jgi:hypothetical protein
MLNHIESCRSRRLAGAAAIVFMLSGCSVFSTRPAMPISEVVEASKSGEERAIEQVRSARTSYALKGSDFGKLADAGVPDKVLDHLQQALYNDVDLLTRHWVLGESMGGCNRCYPQPVDLSTLAAGGTGMGDASNLGQRSTYARPQGLPDWVTAYPGGVNAPAMTSDDAEQLVKQGQSAETVVAQIEQSRAHDFIDHQAFLNVSTHFVPGLKGSELATLHRNGVPDTVLDALQRKYLAEFIEFNRVRYQNWGKGSTLK